MIKNRSRRTIRPTHPGEMLREDLWWTTHAVALARALGASRQTINESLGERRAVTPAMALKLARLFGNTPEFWLDAQRAVDLWDAQEPPCQRNRTNQAPRCCVTAALTP